MHISICLEITYFRNTKGGSTEDGEFLFTDGGDQIDTGGGDDIQTSIPNPDIFTEQNQGLETEDGTQIDEEN